jgi:hypothetical protein
LLAAENLPTSNNEARPVAYAALKPATKMVTPIRNQRPNTELSTNEIAKRTSTLPFKRVQQQEVDATSSSWALLHERQPDDGAIRYRGSYRSDDDDQSHASDDGDIAMSDGDRDDDTNDVFANDKHPQHDTDAMIDNEEISQKRVKPTLFNVLSGKTRKAEQFARLPDVLAHIAQPQSVALKSMLKFQEISLLCRR